MSQQPQAALRNVPRVVFRPAWDNAIVMSYLLRGIFFFAVHPFMYPLLKARLLPAILLSAFIVANLFIWTYLPQVAFLALFHKTGSAWVNGTFLVLGESSAITAILFECFLADETQSEIFDAVLIYKGHEDLVKKRRTVTEDALNDPVRRLGKQTRWANYTPFSFRQIAEFAILLPLNFVPYFGVPMFLFLTGYRAGPLQHWRYYKLLDYDRKQRNTAVRRRRWQYTWYGTLYLTLQLLPPISMLFLLTASVSSALWAADLENLRRDEEARLTEGPRYTDEDDEDEPDETV